jgi:predicted CoA-binding protein
VTPDEVLDATTYIIAIDYPSADVPETIVRAGFMLITHEGPGPLDYYVWTIKADAVTKQQLDHSPAGADLVYTYRPLAELEGIVEEAKRWGARTIWLQRSEPDESGIARSIVETAGLTLIDAPDIRDAVRSRQARR